MALSVIEQRYRAVMLVLDGASVTEVAGEIGAINWGRFFGGHPGTPGKLACFAFEHLEIAGYEQVERVAERVDDTQSAGVVEQILGEERAAASKLAAAFDTAATAALEEQRVS